MLARLALVLWAAQAPQEEAQPLVEQPVLQKLLAAGGEIAKLGDAATTERMLHVLAGLGADQKVLEKQARTWDRNAASARAKRSAYTAAAARLRRELAPLVGQLQKENGERRAELARWIVELDSDQPEAQEILGRQRDTNGEWIDAEQAGWKRGAQRVAGQIAAASGLTLQFERGTSENPALIALYGGGNVVKGYGIALHSNIPCESLERILRQSLRAAAIMHGLLLERPDPEIPTTPTPLRYVLLTSDAQTRPAMDEAVAHGGMTEEESKFAREMKMSAFYDARGWKTVRWASEAVLSSGLLMDIQSGLLMPGVQPCLTTGELNWLCLRFLGTSMPLVLWSESDERGVHDALTITRKDEAWKRQVRWRSAQQTLWGCRSWMIGEVRARRDPPWSRAMKDQEGKIRDENLLKTTLVCEFLQEQGRLYEVMRATSGASDPVAAFEKALGEPVPEFEARWRRWLLGAHQPGLVQELEAGATSMADEGKFAAGLLALNQARSAALEGQAVEVPIVSLDPDLCRAAELHARYLTLNPKQKPAWPAAHDEYADSPGFTSEGSLSGGRSVISYDGDPARSVRGWLDTFYHRLPLLSPGLFCAGFGTSEEVVVLDASSLVLAPWKDHVVVWPAAGAKDVPRRYAPEIPNPVPGADMAEFGYCVSLQLFRAQPENRPSVVLELFLGEPDPKNAVECHVITPEAPLFVDLAPENAWALIPKRALAKNTRYSATAVVDGKTRTWSFVTGG